MKWWDWMPWFLFFWMLIFKPAFSLSSFTFIKRLFSSSLLSAVRVVSFAYLRLLIFLLAILIPACLESYGCDKKNSYKLDILKQHIFLWKCIFSQFWRQDVWAKVSACLVSSERHERRICPYMSPWPTMGHLLTASSFVSVYPHVSLCVPISYHDKISGQIGLGSLVNQLLKSSVSKCSHILKSWGQSFNMWIVEGTWFTAQQNLEVAW